MAQEDFAEARARFEAAAESYGAVSDALDQRVQQRLADARLELSQRGFDACLARVDEVLALVPDQPDALALSSEAERGVREEAERRRALERQYDAARERLATGDLEGAIGALDDLVEADPDRSDARQLLSDARGRLAEERARAASLAAAAPSTTASSDGLDDQTMLQRLPVPEPSRESPVSTAVPAEPLTAHHVAGSAPSVEPASSQPPAASAVEPRPASRSRRPLLFALGGALVAVCAAIWVSTVLLPSLEERRKQAEIEQARRHFEAARDDAVKREANLLAPGPFAAAAALGREAEEYARAHRFEQALQLLREGASRYADSGRVAQDVAVERSTADQARKVMLAEKAKAAPEAPEFKQALAREAEGEHQYGEIRFADAAASFQAAGRLFAAVPPPPPSPAPPAPGQVPPPPPPPPPDPTAAIREVIGLYSRVFDTRNLALLQQIRPGISPDELKRFRDAFDMTRSYRVRLQVESVKVNGDEAEARGRREDIMVSKDGETVRTSTDFNFRFKRANNRWTIASVR